MKTRRRLAPRVKIHPNGTVTLSGLHYRDLRSILTAASLHHYDTEKKHREKEPEVLAEAEENEYGLGEVVLANYRDDGIWIRRIRAILEMCDKQICPPYQPVQGPVGQLDRLGIFTRLRHIRQERDTRIAIDKIMADLFGSREAGDAEAG